MSRVLAPGAAQLAAQRLRDKIRFGSDPVAWMRERLGRTMWSKPQEIARSIVEKGTPMKLFRFAQSRFANWLPSGDIGRLDLDLTDAPLLNLAATTRDSPQQQRRDCVVR